MSDVIAGRYELGGRLGAGGSAEVFVAHDRTLDRPVAVKLLDGSRALSADPAGHERFLREGPSSARFSHPNAIAVFDAGDDAGRLFIVMEYVAGGSLAERLAAVGPLPEAEVARIGTQLLGALGAAHAAGLVHRDVKPSNVLFDASGTVKLADFGIAHRLDDLAASLTTEGMAVGTRGYIAPEQARGEPTDPRTDLYGVGAVLYEAATGERPPPTPPDAERGADPRARRSDLDPALATAISTAMAGAPAHRFASADAMAGALQGATVDGTAVAPASVAPTAALPLPSSAPSTTPMPAGSRPERAKGRRSRSVVTAAFAVVALGTVLAVAAFAGSDDPEADDTAIVTSRSTIAAPTSPSTAAPTTSSPASSAVAPPSSTAPVVSEPPVTAGEVVPGLPSTDDPDEFIAFLRDDKDRLAGREAKQLGNKLRAIRREDDPAKQDDKIDKLVDDITAWVEDGKLEPVVAQRALDLLVGQGGADI